MSYNSGRVNLISSAGGNGAIIPNATQTIHSWTLNTAAAAAQFQLCTPDASHNYYFLGYHLGMSAATSPEVVIYDAAAGAPPTLTAGTGYTDAAGLLANNRSAIAGVALSSFLPVGKKLTNGLRVQAGAAGANGTLIIYYMEEAI